MRRKQVRFVGNCQSNALANFYRQYVGTPSGEDVISIDDLGLDNDGICQAVSGADVVVLQERDFKHVLSGDALGDSVVIHTFPLIMAGFLWPHANEAHVHNVTERPISDGPYPSQMGDSFLNRLIQKGVPAEEALERYLALDIGRVASLDRMCEIYLDRQRQRDAATDFALADFIEANFRARKLFLTAEHPDAALFALAAQQLFGKMGVPGEITSAALATLFRTPFPPTELPLHPGVIAHFGLGYADDQTRYRYMDEGRFTFAEYVIRYMNYVSNPLMRSAVFSAESQPPASALAAIERALMASPGSSRGFQIKGRLLGRLDRLEEACAAFERAIANDPGDPDLHIDLARALIRRGALDEAKHHAQIAIDLAPAFSSAHVALAEVHIASGEREEARRCGAEALLPGPVNGLALHELSLALVSAGSLAEAETLTRRGLAEDGSINHANLLAEILEEQGRRGEAVALLDERLADGTGNDQTYSLLGNFWLRDGRLDLAEDAFERGTRLFGDRRADLAACLDQVRQMQNAARQAGGGVPRS